MTRILRTTFALILRGYHRVVSPVLPAACRFHPSCSVYASEAILKHGVLKGMFIGLGRLSRCHPWNSGGYDPVR